jgi:hypothetical protein
LDDGDNKLVNFSIIANWMLAKRHPINYDTLDNALQRSIINSQNSYKLRWKKKLQDNEREAQRKRDEAAAPPPRQERTSVSTAPELTLSPQMQAHREKLHRSVEGAPAPRASDSELRREAEAVLLNTNSHVIREQASRILLANNGVVDWAATAKARAAHIAAATARRQNAGR